MDGTWWKAAWKRPVKARFIRFSFPDGPQRKCPALAEVEVQGILPTFLKYFRKSRIFVREKLYSYKLTL